MSRNLEILIKTIAVGALASLHQHAQAEVVVEAKENNAFPSLRSLLKKPGFILKAINVNTGQFNGNFHRSHRSHSSHRSHYSSSSGSSGSSGGSYSSPSYSSPSYSSPSSGSTSSSYQLGDRTLKYGMKGNDVQLLKQKLVAGKYYYQGTYETLDNEFNKETYNAIKRLQKAHQLTEDGVAGPSVILYLDTPAPSPSYSAEPSSTGQILGLRDLIWGMTGDDVIELKKLLLSKGYYQLSGNEVLNNRFDDRTETAVKSFQQKKGITVNGIADSYLIALLKLDR